MVIKAMDHAKAVEYPIQPKEMEFSVPAVGNADGSVGTKCLSMEWDNVQDQQQGEVGGVDRVEEEEEKKEDFDWSTDHVFVLSSAGKPIFSLNGDEQCLSTLMGLVQGILSLSADCGEEMESISAIGGRLFVFLRRQDLILVAVGSSDDEGGGCEAFLRLQLEYMYANILFLLTSKMHSMFKTSPGFDLRGLLGGADMSLRGLMDLSRTGRGRGRLLAGGVETVWMEPGMRSRVAAALSVARSRVSGTLYALWLCGEELVAMAQPKQPPEHQLRSQDVLLLVNFVATQSALRRAESWTPVCLPRFHERGYLYAYIAFLEPPLSAQSLPPSTSGATGEMRRNEEHTRQPSSPPDPPKPHDTMPTPQPLSGGVCVTSNGESDGTGFHVNGDEDHVEHNNPGAISLSSRRGDAVTDGDQEIEPNSRTTSTGEGAGNMTLEADPPSCTSALEIEGGKAIGGMETESMGSSPLGKVSTEGLPLQSTPESSGNEKAVGSESRSSTPSDNESMHSKGRNTYRNTREGIEEEGQEVDEGSKSAPEFRPTCLILMSVEGTQEQFQAFRKTRALLEQRFQSILDGSNWNLYLSCRALEERRVILARSCAYIGALHFYYRLGGLPTGTRTGIRGNGRDGSDKRSRISTTVPLTQVLSSPFVGPLIYDPIRQKRIWGQYTKGALRLRRGSCRENWVGFWRRWDIESAGRGGEAVGVTSSNQCVENEWEQRRAQGADGGSGSGGFQGRVGDRGEDVGAEGEATLLFESDPCNSLVYEVGETETVVSISGSADGEGLGGGEGGDELHVCFPSVVSPSAACEAAARLATIVRRDRGWLFLTGPAGPKCTI
ncbi:unnamed protein product [Choristocarpus tenellus]